MNHKSRYGPIALLSVLLVASLVCASVPEVGEKVQLPKAKENGPVSVEEALWQRRTVREFRDASLKWEQIGQLLWAAQGVNRPEAGKRTSPSAGATYPIELFVVLKDGIYQYVPVDHAVVKISGTEQRSIFLEAVGGQEAIRSAPAAFVFCAIYQRTREKYEDNAERYVLLEGGHAAQNLLLQAAALGLGGVPVGGIHDESVRDGLGLKADHLPFYIIPIGYEKEADG